MSEFKQGLFVTLEKQEESDGTVSTYELLHDSESDAADEAKDGGVFAVYELVAVRKVKVTRKFITQPL